MNIGRHLIIGLLLLHSGNTYADEQSEQISLTAAVTKSWQSTIENSERRDLLEERPQLIWLYAGSGYDKQFNSPRGHQFAVHDVTSILRTGDGTKSASCWTCKGPAAAQAISDLGEKGFGRSRFAEIGPYMSASVSCKDCHDNGSELALSRPHALKAMDKVDQPFAQQNQKMKAAQTCGQCHVTYYFQPEAGSKVNIPWIFGNTADLIEKYYDTRGFFDWIHPISGTPMVKARHPEYEHWSRSAHAEVGVTCVTCHMPTSQDVKGRTYTNHNVSRTWQNFDQQCASCHESKGALQAKVETNKAKIDEARTEVEWLLVQAHAEAGALQQAGFTEEELGQILMGIRHAQWRWDFAISSHGVHVHNPKEALELLSAAKRHAMMTRARLGMLLAQKPELKVSYPDLSTKQSAHNAIGLDAVKLTEQKQQFIQQQVKGKWPGWELVDSAEQ